MSVPSPFEGLREVPIATQPLERLTAQLDAAAAERVDAARVPAVEALPRVWNVSSTARGGGVAELLASLLAYARGAGLDARWLVLEGDPEFFAVTKRLHNMLHGHPGDGGRLDSRARASYERTLGPAARGLAAAVRPGDVVMLHDPQTAGLAPAARALGARVLWRCHIGTTRRSALVDEGWDFLEPYLAAPELFWFSARAFVPERLAGRRVEIVHPSIDPGSPKNQPMTPATVDGILAHTGLAIDGDSDDATFVRADGSPGRVERFCEVRRTGPSPRLDEPVVVQVSRWDRLKDPIGVMRGFCEHVLDDVPAQLLLAGPNVSAVADDPEGAEVLAEVEAYWRTLPHAERRHVQLACLPMRDIEENGAIVNALQRGADVVVQKSLEEGFGLTVTEAMWKARPVVASAVGGICEQITDGRDGRLVAPNDLAGFGRAVTELLLDPEAAAKLGGAARETVAAKFLQDRHLMQMASSLAELTATAPEPRVPA